MTEYVNVRASATLDQGELITLLKTHFPSFTKPVGRNVIKGTECVEARLPFSSPEFAEIRRFIQQKRTQGEHGYIDFSIGSLLRKYSKSELRSAEILRLIITPHFEPSGEECGTIYETHCDHCNWGAQLSDLILDLRRVPQGKDIAETIAWVEWVASDRFARTFRENNLTGAVFRPIVDFRNPTKASKRWNQLWVTGGAGVVSERTELGKDPFLPSEVNWRCPFGHAVVTQFLSEIYLDKRQWDGSDIAITESLFGQGRNLLRPTPLIIISQRMYRAMEDAGIKGFSVEVAHFA